MFISKETCGVCNVQIYVGDVDITEREFSDWRALSGDGARGVEIDSIYYTLDWVVNETSKFFEKNENLTYCAFTYRGSYERVRFTLRRNDCLDENLHKEEDIFGKVRANPINDIFAFTILSHDNIMGEFCEIKKDKCPY
jgi:hypothetical protein